jgi:hypothetical protein
LALWRFQREEREADALLGADSPPEVETVPVIAEHQKVALVDTDRSKA